MAFRILHHLQKTNLLCHRVSAARVSRSLSSQHESNGHTNSQQGWSSKSKWACAGCTIAGSLVGYLVYNYTHEKSKHIPVLLQNSAQAKSSPVYSSMEVAKHSSKESGIWVSYKDSVYDITSFVDSHPGGDKILLGAGGPIDPFWHMYAVHQTPEVLEMLEQYKIGKLLAEDQKPVDLNDPFADEPKRLPVLRINSSKPFNAEPPLEVITDSFITPNELFYVRNHLPVPKVDPKTFRLEVKVGEKTLSLSLDDIKTKYKPVTVTTTLQCAGNRREEMSKYRAVKGLSWGTCAIGTARWTGVRLRDLLIEAGFNVNDKSFKHIQFNGKDDDITKESYGASIPKSKAMSLEGDVVIAYKMNGVDIPRDHGYPLRAIVPGYVGARNVKWLHQVVASDEESRSHWQRKDYKGFSPSATYETADYDKAQAIQEMPVMSAISFPKASSTVDAEDGMVEVKGYAWSGGGRGIIRVDVSSDGGKTWKEADLVHDQYGVDDSSQNWAWTLWSVEVPVEEGKEQEIVCKAIDSAYNCQPESIAPIWNLRGFLTNAWHRVSVQVAKDEDD